MTSPEGAVFGKRRGLRSRMLGERLKPSMSPTAYRPSGGMPDRAAASMHASPKRSWPTRTFASQSDTMYAISGPTRWWLIGTRYQPACSAAR